MQTEWYPVHATLTADTPETVSADPENKTGNKTGIRILPDGSSGLRIWRKRYFRICRFRLNQNPNPEELAAIAVSPQNQTAG